MKISISAGNARVVRESMPPRLLWSARSQLPFTVRRQLVLDKVARIRRTRLRVIEGGKH